ncbi:amidohydrolase [Bowmanella sp. Y26]|uniref:amidohydrolase n=1 Tax=Bowmanella yangjiangensis TaxID=2811230 RepID=UPI001BDCA4C8|nr:amidohydrolase [Bowmanella yangjiangensis]MBT1065380.1 amidohydrolase [Bowmanella yangjiangensis]
MKLGYVATLLLLAGCASQSNSPIISADRVILGANILTQDPNLPTASALAIKDGKILLVGSDTQVQPLIGDNTVVHPLNGQTVLPGLIDSHIHSIEGALALLACNLNDQAMDLNTLGEHIQTCASQYPGDWLEVLNLPSVGLALDKQKLDQLLPDRPLFIISTDGHTGWANSLALKRAGITADTQAPHDGRIVKDAQQQPTGMLVDGATALVSRHLPKPDLPHKLQAMQAALAGFYQHGITSFLEANSNADSVALFCSLKQQHQLQAKVNLALGSKGSTDDEEFARLHKLRNQAESCGLMADTIKLYADGVMEYPTQSAALHAPYLNSAEHGDNWRGKLYIPPTDLDAFVQRAQVEGFSLHIHAIGDAAISESLDAFAKARAVEDSPAVRFSITHLQLISPEDITRFAEFNVLASMQLLWAQPDEYSVDALAPYLGEHRHNQIYPAASLRNAGASIAGGSDWNVSDYNPFAAMAVAISRQNLQEPARPSLNSQEALPLSALLEAYTRHSAELMGIAAHSGQLKSGMDADIVILDRQLMDTSAPQTVADTKVSMTLIDGKVVYDGGTQMASGQDH